MTPHGHDHPDLTRNQSLVFNALTRAPGPLSAYSLLDQLRDKGLRAPLQVYRALDKLVAFGMVHRLESLNAFVACRHPDCETHENIAFTICEENDIPILVVNFWHNDDLLKAMRGDHSVGTIIKS